MRKLADLVIHQGNVYGIHRNIASHSSHGNSHISHFQGRRVIDAVSHHADRHPGRLTAADPFHLILRQTFRMNRMDSQLAGNVLRRVFMIPCQQHRLHMHGGKLSNHLPGFRPQRIRQRQNPFQGSVHRQVNDGTTLFQILLSRFRRPLVRCTIIMPTSDMIVLTPISPHTLNARSIVLPSDVEIDIHVKHPGRDGDTIPVVNFDADAFSPLLNEDIIRIAGSSRKAKLIKISKISFLETLRRKMADQ